jgi:hypothetical protein
MGDEIWYTNGTPVSYWFEQRGTSLWIFFAIYTMQERGEQGSNQKNRIARISVPATRRVT